MDYELPDSTRRVTDRSEPAAELRDRVRKPRRDDTLATKEQRRRVKKTKRENQERHPKWSMKGIKVKWWANTSYGCRECGRVYPGIMFADEGAVLERSWNCVYCRADEDLQEHLSPEVDLDAHYSQKKAPPLKYREICDEFLRDWLTKWKFEVETVNGFVPMEVLMSRTSHP